MPAEWREARARKSPAHSIGWRFMLGVSELLFAGCRLGEHCVTAAAQFLATLRPLSGGYYN